MDNDAITQQQPPVTLPQGIRHYLGGRSPADGDGEIRIVTASTRNWAELSPLSVGELVLGDDGFIRLALWSASKCCAALLGSRQTTVLVSERGFEWEIRCCVMANTVLATYQPLSGFLLKPVELIEGHASRDIQSVNRRSGNSWHRADETRLALLDAFPVGDDEKNVSHGTSTL